MRNKYGDRIETAIAAVIAAIFLVNKEEEENRDTVLDLPNVLAVRYTKERHIPRITGFLDNVVPAYPLSVFKESFRLSRCKFETLTEMLA